MKTNLLVVALLATGWVGMTTSCSDDDNYTPEDIYIQAFEQMYPDASQVEWETKQGFKVADFQLNKKETEAWFDLSAQWIMTETDLRYADLPEAIQTAFKAGEYGSWHVDDVDRIERLDSEVVYLLEVESGKQEYDLYFAPDGTLLKVAQEEGNTGHQPLSISQKVMDKIRELYPGTTTFLEFEREGGYLEVEIRDGKRVKEVYFDNTETWAFSQWEIHRSEVPEVVMNALNASEYGKYKMDDVHMFHTIDGLFYLFEMEKGKKEYYCMFSADGTAVDVPAVAYR